MPSRNPLAAITIAALPDGSSLSLRMIESYREAVGALLDFLYDLGLPTAIEAGGRAHLQAFVSDQLARYLRLRSGHRLADLPDLWLARLAPLTSSGVYQMLQERARRA